MDSQSIKNKIAQQLTFSMKNYLDKNERMVTRMSANMEKDGSVSPHSNTIDLKRKETEEIVA
jgi:hypothetical protein